MSHWLEQNKTPVIVLVLLFIAAGIMLLGLRWRPVEPITIEPPLPTPTHGPIRVYVSGAVAQPEVYMLAPDTIVRDAVLAAGGATADADLNLINLAQPLQDGQQIYVPHVGDAVPQPAQTTVLSSQPSNNNIPGNVININTATLADLDTLPGIGPAIAQRIIDYRNANGPFTAVEDILNVSGIGPATFEKIKDLIKVN